MSALAACSLFTSLGDLSEGDTKVVYVEKDGEAAESGASSSGGPADAATPTLDANTQRSAAYASAVLADAPRFYLRFEEGSDEVAKDETGRYRAEWAGTPTRGIPGVAGSTAFGVPAGSPGYLKVPSADFRFAGNAAFTIETWLRPTVLVDYLWIITTEDTPEPRRGWSLLTGAERNVMFEVWSSPPDGGLDLVRYAPIPSRQMGVGSWQHVVVVYDGTNVRTYLDAVRLGTVVQTNAAPDTGDWVTIGCRLWTDGSIAGCFDGGELDEVAIYDKPLSEARIKAHHDLGVP